MDKTEFINYLKTELNKEFDDKKLLSYYWQINASRLRVNVNYTYNLQYLLEKIQNITTLSCLILQEEKYNNALTALNICAKLLFNLVNVPECSYDKEYLLIIGALCFDIAGYQANAYCIAKDIENYYLETSEEIELTEDNKIIEQVIYILQKRLPLAYKKIKDDNSEKSIRYSYFEKAVLTWYEKILELKNDDYLKFFNLSYRNYLQSNNIYIAKILLLLKTKILLSEERLVLNKIYEKTNPNQIWNKYIKLLSKDVFSNTQIKDINERHSIYEFWISQINALNKGIINKDESFVIQMPTSAGKTFIAEIFLLQKLITNPNNHVVYIAPYKALSSEKEHDLGRNIEKLGFSVSELPGSYEMDYFQDLISVETDVLIATPEKIDLLLRSNKQYFDNVTAIVIDEGHLVGNTDQRGSLLEFLIIRLKILYPTIKFLFISAVIPEPDAADLSNWLCNQNTNVITSAYLGNKDWEPTNKLIGRFDWNSSGGNITFDRINIGVQTKKKPFVPNYLQGRLADYVIQDGIKKVSITSALAFKIVEGGETLIFCGTTNEIKSLATRVTSLCESIGNRVLTENINSASYYYANQYFGPEDYRTKALKYGIGIHYSKLPEQVRKNVEQDYKNHILHAIICTNTIGQGLNFPIKNLIIHSVSYKHDNQYLSKKDFWNLVGRAGRAEKEIEGVILFVIYYDKKKHTLYCPDEQSYKKYIYQKDSDTFKSSIYALISDYIEKRIMSYEVFLKNIEDIIDTYLLDLLTEEAIENNFEKITDDIINNSFFNVQLNRNKIDNRDIRNAIQEAFINCVKKVPYEKKQLFSETGLSINSTEKLVTFILSKKDESVDLLENINTFYANFLNCLASNNFKELDNYDLNKLDIDFSKCIDLFIDWVNGESRQILLQDWNFINNDLENFYIFESVGFSYLIPWILSAYLLIIKNIYEIEDSDIEEDIRMAPTYLKYGLNNMNACLAKIHGIHTRELALFLANKFNNPEYSKFLVWLANLSDSEIESYAISEWDKQNIRSVSEKICLKNYKEQPKAFSCKVKGTFFNESFKAESLKINNSSKLYLQRDEENQFDPYAIFVMHDGNPIGYIPKEDSKFISTEMNINNTEYDVKVISVTSKGTYNDIQINLEKPEE